jgi:hypothetical protein
LPFSKAPQASHAGLSGADLTDALWITREQLTQTMSLIGATMPDCQKYEDWFKDKEGRREDGESGGSS